MPCICCSGGRVGGRVGGRAEDADSKPVSQSKERGAPWHPEQKAAAVLVPAVVLAAACVFCVPSQWQQMDSPHAQQVPVCEASFNRLVIKPDWFKDSEAKLEVKDSEAKLEALGGLGAPRRRLATPAREVMSQLPSAITLKTTTTSSSPSSP